MRQLTDFSDVLLLLAYTVVALTYGLLFFTGTERGKRWGPPLLWATVALHLGAIAMVAVRWRQLPVATVSQALSLVAFSVALTYAIVEWQGHEKTTGFWVVVQVWLLQLLSLLLAGQVPEQRAFFGQPLFGLHVVLGLLAHASFAVAASYGFLFLMLYRELKRARYSVFYGKLPPLEVLERMMIVALGLGLVALTGALLSGAAWFYELGREQWWTDPLILITVATWVLYATALLLRRLHRWQGRHIALAGMAGFGVTLTTLVVVGIIHLGFHRAF